jgi:hypothetical protein
MQASTNIKIFAAVIMLAFLSYGCSTPPAETAGSAKPAPQVEQQKEKVYTGAIVGKSDKAKTISISVGQEGQAETMMVKFDDSTAGLQFAEKGEAAVITWQQRGDDKFATQIKPKLAKLPDGVTEIKVEEMYALISANTPMTLVDARPEARFAQAHLPDAISVPVPKLKKLGEKALPADKNRLLILYCGGPT